MVLNILLGLRDIYLYQRYRFIVCTCIHISLRSRKCQIVNFEIYLVDVNPPGKFKIDNMTKRCIFQLPKMKYIRLDDAFAAVDLA